MSQLVRSAHEHFRQSATRRGPRPPEGNLSNRFRQRGSLVATCSPNVPPAMEPDGVRTRRTQQDGTRNKGRYLRSTERLVSSDTSADSRTPSTFSPVVALATGIQLSIYARFQEGVILAATGTIIGLGVLVAVTLRTRGALPTNGASIVFWSAIVPALIAFCFAGTFAIAELLR